MLARLWESFVTATLMGAMCGLVFTVAEGIWPARNAQKRLRPQLVLDVVYLYGGVVLMNFIDLAWLGIAVDAATKTTTFGPALSRVHGFVRGLSFPAELLLAVVVADFTGYWKHRLFHTKLFWPFHAVHHSSEHVDWLSNERMHPIETILTNVIMLAPLVVMGFRPESIAWMVVIRRTHSVYEHTNLRFDYGAIGYLFVSPRFHRWHHASDEDVIDKNYANIFSLWDVVFGTYHVPARPAPNAYGLAGFPPGLVAQLTEPFRVLGARRRTSPSELPRA